MRLLSLKLVGVRNLAPLMLTPGPRFNVLAGENGQGKTNVIEAIYAVCALRSFRTARLAEMIALGQTDAHIDARVLTGDLERTFSLTIRERGRQTRVDGKLIRSVARYFGGFNVVLFAPEDLYLPKRSPSARRRFVDRTVFGRDPGFLPLAQDYDKVLRSRNAILRDPGRRHHAGDLLDVYDHQLAGLGGRIIARRRALVSDIQPRVREAFAAIAGGQLDADVAYVAPPSLADTKDADLEPALAADFAAARAADLGRGHTTVGPHRHDLAFTLAGQPADKIASQGQLRALILAWKIAELDLLTGHLGEPPLLLLDDVSSELDAERTRYLFDFLAAREHQCFITTTVPEHVFSTAERVDFSVSRGVVKPVTEP